MPDDVATAAIDAPTTDAAAMQAAVDAALAAAPGEPAEAPATAPPTPEPPPPPVEKPPVDRVARSLEILARREREVRRAAAELETQRAKVDPILKALESKDAKAIWKHAGISVEDAVMALAEEGRELTPAEAAKRAAEETVQRLLAERQEQERAAAEERSAQRASSVEQGFLRHVTQLAASSPERFPMIQAMGLDSDVLEVVKAHHAETGEYLGAAKAMEMVEAKALEHFLRIQAAVNKQPQIQAPARAARRPLSNATTAAPAATPAGEELSERARMLRAMAAAGVTPR